MPDRNIRSGRSNVKFVVSGPDLNVLLASLRDTENDVFRLVWDDISKNSLLFVSVDIDIKVGHLCDGSFLNM